MNFTKIYKKYGGLWVALDGKLHKVITADRDAKEAYNAAVEKGFKKPTMFKVPRHNLPYVGFFPQP